MRPKVFSLLIFNVLLSWVGGVGGLYAGTWDELAKIQGMYQVMNLKEGMHDDRFRLLHGGISDSMTCHSLKRTFDLPASYDPDSKWSLWIYTQAANARIVINDVFIGTIKSDTNGVVIPVPAGLLLPFRNVIVITPTSPIHAGGLKEAILLGQHPVTGSSLIRHSLFVPSCDSAIILDQCSDTTSMRRYVWEVGKFSDRTYFLTQPPTLGMLAILEACNARVSLTYPKRGVARLRGNDRISWYDRNGNRTPDWGSWSFVSASTATAPLINDAGKLFTYCFLFLFGLAMILIRYSTSQVFRQWPEWILGFTGKVTEIRKGTFLKPLQSFQLIGLMLFLEIISLPMVWTATAWSESEFLFSWVSLPSLFSSWCILSASLYDRVPDAALMALGWLSYRAFWYASFAWIAGLANRLHLFFQTEALTGAHEAILSSFLGILMMISPAGWVLPLLYTWIILMVIRMIRRGVLLWGFSGHVLGFRGFVRILYICVLEFLPLLILF